MNGNKSVGIPVAQLYQDCLMLMNELLRHEHPSLDGSRNILYMLRHQGLLITMLDLKSDKDFHKCSETTNITNYMRMNVYMYIASLYCHCTCSNFY